MSHQSKKPIKLYYKRNRNRRRTYKFSQWQIQSHWGPLGRWRRYRLCTPCPLLKCQSRERRCHLTVSDHKWGRVCPLRTNEEIYSNNIFKISHVQSQSVCWFLTSWNINFIFIHFSRQRCPSQAYREQSFSNHTEVRNGGHNSWKESICTLGHCIYTMGKFAYKYMKGFMF